MAQFTGPWRPANGDSSPKYLSPRLWTRTPIRRHLAEGQTAPVVPGQAVTASTRKVEPSNLAESRCLGTHDYIGWPGRPTGQGWNQIGPARWRAFKLMAATGVIAVLSAATAGPAAEAGASTSGRLTPPTSASVSYSVGPISE